MRNATWIDFTAENVLIAYVNIVLRSETRGFYEFYLPMSN